MLDEQHPCGVVHALLMRVREDRIEVLLLLRARTGRFDGTWAMPAGRVESGETIREAVVRELREEIDVVADPGAMHWITAHQAGDRRHCVVSVARWSGDPRNAEPACCDAVAWFAVDALPEPMVAWVADVIGAAARDTARES